MGNSVEIKVKDNGCLLISGTVRVIDADGNEFTVESDKVALCRCGHSLTKPFCDGSHRTAGFEANERAAACVE